MHLLDIFTGDTEWFGCDVGNIAIQQKRWVNLRSKDLLGKISTERSDTVPQECRVERDINRHQFLHVDLLLLKEIQDIAKTIESIEMAGAYVLRILDVEVDNFQ
jgi:hypothetical protein